jgi:hypothetical protein
LLGNILLDVLDGKVAVSIDPVSGTLTWTSTGS